ncbi:tetratricopeptide repeat protein [Microvirga lotononidis]|uniref:Tetratricopeptide repeat protein n=1 Tax=Microvirga lotononidis TaxID=864069 RepID=I4YKJ9_9HYPH|nr:tetratricopeptide repeat protein [Microvirga lotononidis]EIM24491.1 tetratricopeptide repeat protein [Microvirga lotononidis]WQO26516.1 tetratricopeptide repeat protein [Microvirga lotononidis]
MLKKTTLFSFALLGTMALTPALTSTAAIAVDDDTPIGSVDLSSVRDKIKAANYSAALEELRGLAEDTQQADVYNLLGYTLRKTGDYATSLTYYNKALQLQPDFKAAREYLGELYVETGNVGKAREQLAALTRLCPGGCEEREDLEKALEGK